ncbi:hypothetical protein RhiirC2_821845 [Rhizophagus irregularis]|uniref:Uncharacterized protein n=1 Tax=Rhizophagus irregularis TaxID=588596 RepID=A0A2N1MBJ1_9GLOM|nr:hypothetical protein RhiirC2_821845 [Rhizophagus irregularis]
MWRIVEDLWGIPYPTEGGCRYCEAVRPRWGIDKHKHNITEVERTIERKFGKIKEILSRTENYGKIDMKMQIELRCTEDELMNTWGIIVNEKIIKVEPLNYKFQEIKKRGIHNAILMDIPIELEEEDLTESLYKTGARYWYRESNKNDNFRYSIRVYFKNEYEQKNAMKEKFEIQGQIFTWLFRHPFRGNFNTNNYNRRNTGNRNGYSNERNNASDREYRYQQRSSGIRCSICKKYNHREEECYFNRDNQQQQRRQRSNNNPELQGNHHQRYNGNDKRRGFNDRRQRQNFKGDNGNRFNQQQDNRYPRRYNGGFNRKQQQQQDDTYGQRDGNFNRRYNGRDNFDKRYEQSYARHTSGNRRY